MIEVSASDVEARYLIEQALDVSMMVEASAGTGKTTELVKRIALVLKRGRTTVERVVAVTFTRKAAGELKLRLRQELDRARLMAKDESEKRNLEDATSRLEEARIGTIHSFCAEILRERPAEARVDPLFSEVADDEGPRLYRKAFSRWFAEKLHAPPQGLRRAMHRKPAWDSRTPMERLLDAGHKLAEWRDFSAPWGRQPFDRKSEIDRLVRLVWTVANESAQAKSDRDNLYCGLEPTREFSAWVHKMELDRARDYDLLEGRLIGLSAVLKRDKRKGAGLFADDIPREQMLERRADLLSALDSFARHADADLAAQLKEDLWPVLERYDELKAHAGKLDFLDLLLKTRALICEDQGVRAYLQQRYSHIFVDEFQDTDPLQTEILLLLSADDPAVDRWQDIRPVPGKLFLVGDPKQSIYRFRRADVLLYQSVRATLEERGVKLVRLSRSFRATEPIQSAINLAFSAEMREDRNRGQPGYVPLEGGPESEVQTPSLIALPIPHPHGRYKITNQAVEASLPIATAAFVDWLLTQSGWTVRDPEQPNERVSIQPRHIAILFRRYMSWGEDITTDYVRALEARSVAHVLVGSRSFHRREEIEALRAALSAVEWPEDELSVFAALRGPLFAISDDVLLRFRTKYQHLHPFLDFETMEDLEEDFHPVEQALTLLKRLSKERNDRPIVDTVHAILDATRAHAGFALRPAGNQVLANLQRICDLARSFELSGGISFRGFIDRVIEEAEKERSAESPVLEEGTEGVRIMTVHAAKGLEFPVVILADITNNLSHGQPDRTIDSTKKLSATRLLGCSPWELAWNQDAERKRDEAEGVRVAYVAATRARDILVLPTLGEGAESLFADWGGRRSWVGPLEKVFYPQKRAFRNAAEAPGCPKVGDRTVLSSPGTAPDRAPVVVQPGLHRRSRMAPGVVWWDPATLDLTPSATFGLRQEQYLTRDEDGAIAEEGIRRYEAWTAQRALAIEEGERCSALPIRADEALLSPPDYDPLISVIDFPQREDRPVGRRFASLIQTVFRDLELGSPPDEVQAMIEVHGRTLGARPEEIDHAFAPLMAALSSELLLRAARAPRCHREYPLLFEMDDGQLIDGVIDLAFFEPDGGWVVVDLRVADQDPDRYIRKLQWYLYALEQLTEQPARGVLLSL